MQRIVTGVLCAAMNLGLLAVLVHTKEWLNLGLYLGLLLGASAIVWVRGSREHRGGATQPVWRPTVRAGGAWTGIHRSPISM